MLEALKQLSGKNATLLFIPPRVFAATAHKSQKRLANKMILKFA